MKKKSAVYDYGECEICHTPMKEKLIKQDFWIRGKLIIRGGCPRRGLPTVR